MISFEHQGWTVQIFASAAPARLLKTPAVAVASARSRQKQRALRRSR